MARKKKLMEMMTISSNLMRERIKRMAISQKEMTSPIEEAKMMNKKQRRTLKERSIKVKKEKTNKIRHQKPNKLNPISRT